MTTHEQDLIENLEAHGFHGTARRLRKFLATQNRDVNADPGNPREDYAAETCLFAPPAPHPAIKRIRSLVELTEEQKLTHITPEQARYAFDNALESPPNSIPCDLSQFDRDFRILGAEAAKMEADNSTLAEACAKTDATLAHMQEIASKYVGHPNEPDSLLTAPETHWHTHGDSRVEEFYFSLPLPSSKQGWSGWLVNKAGWLFRRTLPKHRWIYSDGTPRKENACR